MSSAHPFSQPIELQENPTMNNIRNLFQPRPTYEPLDDADTQVSASDDGALSDYADDEAPFSWVDYSIFLLLGVAMLWAWNMFLAAASYFQSRFQSNKWILNHFQPAEVSVSSLTNLACMIVLSKLQRNASYPRRIAIALVISSVSFTLLTLSTLVDTSAAVYLAFLLVIVTAASLGTAFIQNGVFAFVTGFGQSKYTQAIMTGQAVAGVLPPMVQIISVASVQAKKPGQSQDTAQSPRAALLYFITAVAVSVGTLLAFGYLLRRLRHSKSLGSAAKATLNGQREGEALIEGDVSTSDDNHVDVPLTTLFWKLPYLSAALVVCFTVSMVFPVFTSSITSVSGMDSAIFIPVAFLLWNAGDLAGRLITIFPSVSLVYYPFALFCLAMARLLFVPLYFLCNIKGRGAFVNSDVFYLVVVQFLFGMTNGYLGSQCMMGAGEWVLPEERPAAGSFMGLMLVGGLTIGSFLSFLLGDI